MEPLSKNSSTSALSAQDAPGINGTTEPDSIHFSAKTLSGEETNSDNKNSIHNQLGAKQSPGKERKRTVTGFMPISAAEILAKTPEPVEWLWQDYIAKGDLFVFAAYMKVGKSTFMYPLALAVTKGVPFLDRETTHGAVLILALEEREHDVDLRLKKLELHAEDRLYIHYGALPSDTEQLSKVAAFAKEKDVSLILVDSLAYFWDVKNENDNAELMRWLKPIHTLARNTGAAVGLIHHESKWGGRNKSGSFGNGKSIRGGSALFGIVDQALMLDHRQGGKPTERVLKAIGRRSESPRELILELVGDTRLSNPEPYCYQARGTPAQASAEATTEKVFACLADEELSVQQICQRTGIKEKPVRECLAMLSLQEQVIAIGKGVKGDPQKYRRAGCRLDADDLASQPKAEINAGETLQ